MPARRDVGAALREGGSRRRDSRRLDVLTWGLTPAWPKSARIGHALVNALAGTVAKQPSFASLGGPNGGSLWPTRHHLWRDVSDATTGNGPLAFLRRSRSRGDTTEADGGGPSCGAHHGDAVRDAVYATAIRSTSALKNTQLVFGPRRSNVPPQCAIPSSSGGRKWRQKVAREEVRGEVLRVRPVVTSPAPVRADQQAHAVQRARDALGPRECPARRRDRVPVEEPNDRVQGLVHPLRELVAGPHAARWGTPPGPATPTRSAATRHDTPGAGS